MHIEQKHILNPLQKKSSSSIKASILNLISNNYNCFFMRMVIIVKLINESPLVDPGIEQNSKKRKNNDKKKQTTVTNSSSTSPGNRKRFKPENDTLTSSASISHLHSFICKEFYLNILNEPCILGKLNYKKKYSYCHIDNHDFNLILHSPEVESLIIAPSLMDIQIPVLQIEKIHLAPLNTIGSEIDYKLNINHSKILNKSETNVSLFFI